ncbi:MAG TPA: zinc ribbon domain-containing protein [Thermoplasmata archaeon]|nr:zinc ribbon domain-containing protein [Thermoplasmata archaeon]
MVPPASPASGATRLCPVCGSTIPDPSSFCERCGHRIPPRVGPMPIGRYPFPRMQVDPTEDLPYIDARWALLVTGLALAVAGGFLLAVDAVVTGVSPSTGGSVFEYVLEIPGAVLLVVGLVLFLLGLLKTL